MVHLVVPPSRGRGRLGDSLLILCPRQAMNDEGQADEQQLLNQFLSTNSVVEHHHPTGSSDLDSRLCQVRS